MVPKPKPKKPVHFPGAGAGTEVYRTPYSEPERDLELELFPWVEVGDGAVQKFPAPHNVK